MEFLQIAGAAVFVIAACVASFLFGIGIANAYHKQADRKVQRAVISYHESMKENFALSEHQRRWNAEYLPAREVPFLDTDIEVRRIVN